jgi:hypothetical protein
MGTPTVTFLLIVTPNGTSSVEAFGVPTVATTLTSSPDGIASAGLLGVPTITMGPLQGAIKTGASLYIADTTATLYLNKDVADLHIDNYTSTIEALS